MIHNCKQVQPRLHRPTSGNFQYMMNVTASTTASLHVLPRESSCIKTVVSSAMTQYGLTKQEVIKRATETYGSLRNAMQAMETAEAENKAAIERAFPSGCAEIQVGVSYAA